MAGGLENNALQGEQTKPPIIQTDAWIKPVTVAQDATIGAPPGDAQSTGYPATNFQPTTTFQPETQPQSGQAPWRAGYGQVAPAFNNVETQQPSQQQASTTAWRAGYNNVAPIYNNVGNNTGGDQTVANATTTTGNNGWRAPYNGVAPGANNGNTEVNPNANGNQNQGPQWKPPTTVTTWNSPGPAQTGDASSGVPGQPSQANGQNLYDPERPDLNQGLQRPIGFGEQVMIGGIAGVAWGGPIRYALDKTAESIVNQATPNNAINGPMVGESGLLGRTIPSTWRDGLNNLGEQVDGLKAKIAPEAGGPAVAAAKFWQNHYDPRYFQNNALATQTTNWTQLNDQFSSLVDRNKTALSALETANPDLSAASDSVKSQFKVLSERQDWLDPKKWDGVTDGASQLQKLKMLQLDRAKAAAGPAEGEVTQQLFSKDEMSLLQTRQDANAALANIPKTESPKFWGDSPGMNFIKGAGFVGVTMIADNYLDRLFNGKDHQQGFTNSNVFEGVPLAGTLTQSWHTNALLLPMAFATGSLSSPKGLLTKAAWTGAALVGGHVLDAVLPASKNQEVSTLLKPNGIDSVLMAGAWLLPAADMKTRLLTLGGAWAVGRIYNLFQGPSQFDTKNDGFSAMQTDMKDRTYSSMENSISDFKKLGSENDQALRLYTSDWLRPGRQYDGALSSYRGAVILCDAWGESRLAHGTLMPNSTTDFILPGQNLDLGAQALRGLIIAQTNVDRAKQQTQNEMGKPDHDKTVTQSEISDLDKVGQNINNVIQNQIYGKHDIPKAINDLTSEYKNNMKGTTLLMMDINNSLALNRTSTNKQFVGKLFRDLATIDMAMAQYNLQNGADAGGAATFLYGTDQGRQTAYNNGQPRGYDGALDAIALAKQYDPNNPDLPQLEAYAQQLEQKVPGAVQKQQSNPVFNPLNVNDQVNHPGSQPPA